MEELSKENVLVCFYLHEVYLDNGTELPSMIYNATLDNSTIEASNSILSDTGSQIWINQNKIIWNMPRSSYDECINNKILLMTDVKWYSDNDSSDDIACSFSISLPFIEDKVNWSMLHEVTVDDYHIVYHLHSQSCYAVDQEYQQSIVNNVIHLSTNDSIIDSSAADYELNMRVESIENWKELEELLQANHLSSESYSFYTSFYHYYQTDPQASFNLTSPLIQFEPLRFHCPIQVLSNYLRCLQPPVIQLLNQDNEVICEFFPDFEKYSISLACCPSDYSIREGESSVRLHETIELHDLLDFVQDCPVVIQDYTNTRITIRFAISLRKVATSEVTQPSSAELAQIQVLQLKLKNFEEFQAETVKHYEKELERKQNTITKLTQANRKYEKVFIESINAPTSDAIQLRNENEQLKAEISKLKEKIADLQKQNDEMREIMVNTVTKELTDSE